MRHGRYMMDRLYGSELHIIQGLLHHLRALRDILKPNPAREQHSFQGKNTAYMVEAVRKG